MDRDELFTLLDIESGSQFEYFENFADFVESDCAISDDAVYELMREVDMKTFAELCESYFYDALESVPGRPDRRVQPAGEHQKGPGRPF